MRLLLATALTALLAAPALAETKSFNLSGFRKIEADSAFTVEFTQSPTFSVVVDSRYDNLDKIIVEKVGDTLRITRPNNTNIRHEVEDVIRISAPTLDAIKLHSAVNFSADRLNADALSITTHSATKVVIRNLNAKSVAIDAHSAASFKLDGECGTLSLKIHSASKVEASGLHCRETTINAGTASSAAVWASEKAFAEAGVAAKVRVSGKPRDFQKKGSDLANIALAD